MTKKEEEQEFIQQVINASDQAMGKLWDLIAGSKTFKDHLLREVPTTGKIQ